VAKIQLSHLHIKDDGEDSDPGPGPNSPEKRRKLTDTDVVFQQAPSKKTPRRTRKTAESVLDSEDIASPHQPFSPSQQSGNDTFEDGAMDADDSQQDPTV